MKWRISLRDAEDYELLLSYFVRAVKLYPFDEWQIGQMECLLEMGRTREAMHIYDKISKLYFEELGLPPSEKMKDCFARMSKMLLLDAEGFQEIHNALKEKADPEGAYYCSYPGFVDAYRVLNRVLDRMNQSVFLMLCTITDVRDREIENKERLKNISEKLGQAIQGGAGAKETCTPVTAPTNTWCCSWVSAKRTVPSHPGGSIRISGKERRAAGSRFPIGWYLSGILMIKWFQRTTKNCKQK